MIRIDTLGTLHVTRAGAEAEGLLKQRLRAALLVYLAIERVSTRDSVLAMFWPDRDAERGRHALSQTLYELRKVLGDEWLRTEGDRLIVSDEVQTDAGEFERAVEDGRNAEALALYRGPLLAGVYLAESKTFESWVDRRRARLVRAYRRARRQLIDELIASGEYVQAVRIATQAVDTDPLDDEAQHRLIELLALTGRRADAIAQYETYARVLAHDQLEPLEETRALIERIRAGEVPSATARTAVPVRPAAESREHVNTPLVRKAPRRWAMLAAAASVLVLAGVFGLTTIQSDDLIVLAVLPVENLSGKEEEQYFAVGMHEEIITQLGKIRELNVISRQFVMDYWDPGKSTKQIGQELGANVVLESSVRRERDTVRVAVGLIDASTGLRIWGESYDRPHAAILAIQADIARSVADALGIHLDPGVEKEMERRPTQNLEAYDAYLRGMNYYGRGANPGNYENALKQLHRATELDPNFAEAWGGIVLVNASVYQNGYDASETRRAAAKRALDRATALNPKATAMGRMRYYYYVVRDYRRALAILDSAEGQGFDRKRIDNFNPGIDYERALVLRRMGDYDKSTPLLETAVRLYPRSEHFRDNLGGSYRHQRRYDLALAEYDRAIELAPHWDTPKTGAVGVYLDLGKLDSARARLNDVAPDNAARFLYLVDMLERKYDDAVARTRSMPRALAVQLSYLPKAMLEANAHRLAGRQDAARAKFHEALTVLDSANRALPNDVRITSSLMVVYAGLGRRSDAQREVRKATEFANADNVSYQQKNLLTQAMAEAYVLLGDHGAAIDKLRYLLSVPSDLSAARIALDPTWDPLRTNSRFNAMLREHGVKTNNR